MTKSRSPKKKQNSICLNFSSHSYFLLVVPLKKIGIQKVIQSVLDKLLTSIFLISKNLFYLPIFNHCKVLSSLDLWDNWSPSLLHYVSYVEPQSNLARELALY